MPSVGCRVSRVGPLLPVLVIGVLLAGCGPASSDGSTTHQPSTTSAPPSSSPDETPREDLTAESVVPWTRYGQVSVDQLWFHYTGGDPACYGVRVATQETDTTIEVATIVGTKPDAPPECTLVASLSTVTVTTDQPIGTRTITHLDNPPLHP